MLKIIVPARELWDESKEEFIYLKEQTLQLEHSLISLSKWESKWCKPFLTKEKKTTEELLDYIYYMTLTPNIKRETCDILTQNNIDDIVKYIDSPMTATTFRKQKQNTINNEQVTSEIIYYWMITLHIPFECQKWHLNRLIALIEVCNIKNQPPRKKSMSEILAEHAAINAANRKRFNSKG